MNIKVPKTTQKPKSAEIVASIDDILIDILLRLPIKSLIRFKIVSKHFQSLITNPEFCFRRNPNPNPAVGLFFPELDDPILKYVQLSPNNSITSPIKKLQLLTKDLFGIKILHSCNGLLLCRRSSTKHYVYNPTTNQSSALPAILGENSVNNCGMSLAFDPAKSPHFDVVCVCNDPNLVDVRYQIHIYSSKSGAWRISSEPFAAQLDFENGVYWNGAVHWISKWFQDSLYFNVNHHVLEKMPSPPLPDQSGVNGFYFGESCDHLHYIWTFVSKSQFNVYEMKRDYSEWFVKYRVNLSKVAHAYPRMTYRYRSDSIESRFYYFSISSIVRGEEEEDGSFLVLQIPGKVIRYNFVSKTFEKLHEIGGTKYFQLQVGFQFIESLCSL